jgi:hypothetical protein
LGNQARAFCLMIVLNNSSPDRSIQLNGLNIFFAEKSKAYILPNASTI